MRGAPPSFYALAGPLLLLLLLLLVSCRGFRPVPSSTRAGPGTVAGLALFRTHLIRDPLSHPPLRTQPALLGSREGRGPDDSRRTASAKADDGGPGIGEQIVSLAVPALAGLAIDPLMTLADTAFVGRTASGATALAGIGSSAAILTFSFYIFNFLCTATTPLIASRRAAGEEADALAVGGQSLSLSLALGSTVSVGLILLSQPLLSVMGTGQTGPEANAYATSFLVLRALAAPAVLASSASTGILRGYLDTKTPLYILAGANLVNFGLDVILIAGADMGPTGAAIATTTAEWLAALAFLGVLGGRLPSADGELGSNQEKSMVSGGGERRGAMTVVPTLSVPPWEDVKPLVVASSSVFLRTVVLQIALSGAAAMAARNTGVEASASVAAHQIALQLWLLCSFVCDALAAASQALVADALGRENAEDAREISSTIFVFSLGLGGVLSGALALGLATGFLLDFFTTDEATKTALRELLGIIIFAQPLNSFVFAADGVLQGASEFTYQAKSMAVSVFVAISSFAGLEYLAHCSEIDGQLSDTLVHVWEALIVLQFMRALTSLVKLVQPEGPIDLLGKRTL